MKEACKLAYLKKKKVARGKSGSLCEKKRRADIPKFSYFVSAVARECNNMEVPLCPVIPDFRKRIAFWKVSRLLRQFVLLERTACRWKWVWSTGEVILTREDWSTWRKIFPSAILSTGNLTRTGWGLSPGLWDKKLATDGLILGTARLKAKVTAHYKDSVRTF